MTDDDHRRPTTDQPLNAPGKRPRVMPVLAVIGLVVVLAVVFLLLTSIA